jgi:cyclic beta-1,2-glucan synthetase
MPRLDESAARLDEAYTFLSAAAKVDPQPSEDWLRDNHHVVQDQVRGIRQHLPGAYYKELPKLAEGEFQGFPRVYLLARELTGHTAGRIDLDTVVDFVRAYQRGTTLTIGETWAVPIMLRLALVEQLRRLAAGVVASRKSRDAARRWHEALAADKTRTPARIRQALQDGRTPDGRLAPAFVMELLQWLRDQPPAAVPIWTALHDALAAQGESADEMLRVEHQREAADQLAIGNVITSMRLLSSIDWTLFFERVSVVERMLREDPAGAYAQMDFPTRDRYRDAVEQVAKRARLSESEVAATAIALARAARDQEGGHDRPHHVGYYLISRGRFQLEPDAGYRPTLRERTARFAFDHQALGYLGTMAGMTAAGVGALLVHAARHGATDAQLWLVAIVVLLPVSELAINLLNLIVTSQVPPRPLPKLALLEGIPPASRTMVVVPAIVDSTARLRTLVDDLEVRFLGNRDPRLHFALLADFADAAVASRDGDDALLEAARQAIDDLNERHGAGRFFYFHRERRWNPSEGRWMGWERKRGKLTEFNRLLRGATDTSFILCHGDLSLLPSIKYVITLDSDTQLPMEAGRRLVGTLSHPLNKPRFDPAERRVTEGYGVLQPRVGVDLVSANRTTFAKVFSGHVGVDPYTTAVSDVYQDLFHEGSYVGKGIYDVDAFDAALAGRVPENALLSHDLFEGFYARAGLTTDTHLVDDYPADYLAFAARQHRWVRGDWQIVRWLWRTVPNAERRPVPNQLGAIARWKILDNLRRSLIAPALLLLLVLGWTVLPGSTLLWTGLAVMVLAFPAYIQVARSLGSRVRGVPWRQHVIAERDNIVTSARQALLWSIFLAHQSWLMLDAIVRTLWRLLVSRRRLLEWVTADRFARRRPTARVVLRRMWMAPAVALGVLALVATLAPGRLLLALTMIVLWVISPWIALTTGRPIEHARQAPGRAERLALRAIARRTWRYFEDLLSPADHWLIPDNYQEDRGDPIAHRTSPTNVGLQLLATVSAHHFGYLSLAGVVDRLEPTFATLDDLPRYRGHFFNWYDTQTLAPLLPKYVSTVDSGNLAGYLLTLNGALQAAVHDAPLIDAAALEGIEDAIGEFESCLAPIGSRAAGGSALGREVGELRARLREAPGSLAEWRAQLAEIGDRIATLELLLQEADDASSASGEEAPAEAHQWLERASMAAAQRLADLSALASWTAVAGPLPGAFVPAPPAIPLVAYVSWCRHAAAALGDDPAAQPVRAALDRSASNAQELVDRALRLAERAEELAGDMDFTFLFDRQRQLFSIGFSVTDGRLDASYYDTLASEARLASFVAIASGQIAHEHWFKLGRSLTSSGTARALLSWSASMFEYFMPLLVMRVYPGTLLDETYRAVLQRQRQYGARRSVPWGISESAYNAVDLDRNYQYRAFGVPGLGLKTGLAEDLVVAPYASLLAASLAPLDVLENLLHFEQEGALGRYGFFEAIDYTPERQGAGDRRGVVLRTYMAHHQGMSLVALDNALHDAPMQRYFHADPRIQAADLLLQERIPRLAPLRNPPVELAEHVPSARAVTAVPVLRHATPHTLSPRGYLLSNGSYTVMVTTAGGGYSRRQQTALTRWREDVTTDAWGSFCYVRDLESGTLWSSAYHPTGREADEYEVTFAPDRVVFRRVDDGIETRTEIVVSPEDDAEVRRVLVTNLGTRHRTIELTSYREVVLAPHDADLAHPAFSNLFVETASVPGRSALLCARRPRSGRDRQYLVHVLSGTGRAGVETQFETDRAKFIGRGGTLARPLALISTAPLSATTGPVLDPIVSLRQSVRVPPGATVRLAFTTAYAATEADARALVEKYHDRRAVARAIALAGTHSQVELRHLNLELEDTMRFQRLGARLITGDARLRSVEAIATNVRGQRDLWQYGISGDMPILLVRIAEASHLPLVAELLKAHEYLRIKGLAFDLVVLNEHPASYLQALHDETARLVERSPEHPWLDRPGGVFLRRADLMPHDDQVLLRAVARIVMDGADGGLRPQLARASAPVTHEPTRTIVSEGAATPAPAAAAAAAEGLAHFNGTGGFAGDGREYVIPVHLAEGHVPPGPWSNVVAQAGFGFACTELGPGYTWSGNSHDNRLTPWNNDPVCDPAGEAVYIRDEETGAFWSATPLPAGGGEPYVVRHGQGASSYEHARGDLRSDLVLFVPRDEPVKVFRLSLHNASGRARRLSVTLYADWVLGENRSRTASHVVTGTEPDTGAVIARNVFRQQFQERVAFLDLGPAPRGRAVTGDRTEFIGRNGSLERPAALGRRALSGRTGAALDPCGAVQVHVDLEPGASQVLIGLLGDAADAGQAGDLVRRFRDQDAVDAALADVRGFWDARLGTITVRTPDAAMDLVLNRWLLYQTLACRVWGRSAFYQSSGAFGFRDQLQDVLALVASAPHLVRAHLLHAASRQFVEGDVQHWWHEPGGQGVRTRFSDDRLWLVYATLRYLEATGDDAVLDEQVPFLSGRPLDEGEHEAYEQPSVSPETGSLYEHCRRAIAVSFATGAHGLPLMGTGDWNDGMSLVGAAGRGESVWLASFLVSMLPGFAEVAAARGDVVDAAMYREHAAALTSAIEAAWDGAWYRRAYFDDGTPLGSKANDECRIDAIAQSWAVLAGTLDPQRVRQAMASVEAHLIRRDDRLALLLAPPFDRMEPDPGYIRGYLPGVRENGGQYTHAALWNVLAFARLGDGDRAAELFSLLNPVNYTRTPEDVARYRAEPYVVAADVYSVPPHTGRGGWTWYTGSAGWMYRVGIEAILGLTLRRGALHIDPCIPREWPGFEAVFKPSRTPYRIVVRNPSGVCRGVKSLELDGADITGQAVPVVDDGVEHRIVAVLG